MPTKLKPSGVDTSAQFSFDSISTSTVVVGNVAISDSGNGNIQVATVAANGEIGTPAAIAGGGVTVYATAADLPLVSVANGAQAYVSSTNRLYLWTGTGWFNVALINTEPTITTGPEASYTLDTAGTPTVITLEASDPEGVPITWSYQVTSGSLGSTATVTQSNNIFTITPSTNEADAGTFSITFTASDGVNIDTAAASFTLKFTLDWTLQATLQSPNVYQYYHFGSLVSLADGGTTLAVAEGSWSNSRGRYHVYTPSGNTWVLQSTFTSSIATEYKSPASMSISHDGNTIAVGWPEHSYYANNSGAAAVFVRSGNTWSEQALFSVVDPLWNTHDKFGQCVSLSGDGNTLVAGHPTGWPNERQGSVTMWTRSGTTWTKRNTVQASDGGSADQFGRTLAASGDGSTIVVGAYKMSSLQGAAYVYTSTSNNWTQQAKLTALDPTNTDFFGWSTAISSDGNTIAVGGIYRETSSAANNAGRVDVFTRSGTTWTRQAAIQASDAALNDNFGEFISLSADGNLMAVSAAGVDVEGVTDTGAVYIFKRSGSSWVQQAKMVAPTNATAMKFGVSNWTGSGGALDINNDGLLAIGAYYAPVSSSLQAGRVYTYTVV